MPRFVSASGSWIAVSGRVTRGFKPPAPASRTSSKEAWPSGTSKESEIKLTNVARASLEELLEDYRDFLRTRSLPLWEKNSREALFIRKLGAKADVSYESYRTYIETRPAGIVANIIVCLIHQTNFLLDRQIRRMEKAFIAEGGLRERMTRARLRRTVHAQPIRSKR